MNNTTIIRVSLTPKHEVGSYIVLGGNLTSGRYEVQDVVDHDYAIDSLHPDIQERIAVLMMLEKGQEVEGVGKRAGDNTFYIYCEENAP